jgi:hypothetical protein
LFGVLQYLKRHSVLLTGDVSWGHIVMRKVWDERERGLRWERKVWDDRERGLRWERKVWDKEKKTCVNNRV